MNRVNLAGSDVVQIRGRNFGSRIRSFRLPGYPCNRWGVIEMRKFSLVSLGTLLVIACALGTRASSHAQDPELAFEQVVGHPRGLPQLPPQGAWGEVINATSRWIVIQNHSGQQYPIAAEGIGEFLVRWPTGLDSLDPGSVVEAIGRDAGSNVVETNHVDVFEGSDRSLVAPTNNQLLPNNAVVTTVDPGFNRLMNAWDYAGQNQLYGWAYPTGIVGLDGNVGLRLHVVGNVVQRVPLQVGLPGNNFATVVPGANVEFTMTQVTRGSLDMVKKGDYAFLMPRQILPKGIVVSQLVLYKTIPYRQFAARR
jgi:hypothetical protein